MAPDAERSEVTRGLRGEAFNPGGRPWTSLDSAMCLGESITCCLSCCLEYFCLELFLDLWFYTYTDTMSILGCFMEYTLQLVEREGQSEVLDGKKVCQILQPMVRFDDSNINLSIVYICQFLSSWGRRNINDRTLGSESCPCF